MWAALAVVAAAVGIAALLAESQLFDGDDTAITTSQGPLLITTEPTPPPATEPAQDTPTTTPETTSPLTPTATATVDPTPTPYPGWVDPASVGQPFGLVPGVLTFRGNPTRTFHGTGPAPESPQVLWQFTGTPELDLCSLTSWAAGITQWCGTGWTGQPAVLEWDERTWVVVGTFAPAVHFLDADTGRRLLPDYVVGDLIKGSVTVDPDGYPLVYFGSRDDYYRIISFDRDEPEELWSIYAYDVSPVLWNNDWDSASLVLDDYLFLGGENSHLHIVKLNRGYNSEGLVTVDPELVVLRSRLGQRTA